MVGHLTYRWSTRPPYPLSSGEYLQSLFFLKTSGVPHRETYVTQFRDGRYNRVSLGTTCACFGVLPPPHVYLPRCLNRVRIESVSPISTMSFFLKILWWDKFFCPWRVILGSNWAVRHVGCLDAVINDNAALGPILHPSPPFEPSLRWFSF